jgi:hypothetical protein
MKHPSWWLSHMEMDRPVQALPGQGRSRGRGRNRGFQAAPVNASARHSASTMQGIDLGRGSGFPATPLNASTRAPTSGFANPRGAPNTQPLFDDSFKRHTLKTFPKYVGVLGGEVAREGSSPAPRPRTAIRMYEKIRSRTMSHTHSATSRQHLPFPYSALVVRITPRLFSNFSNSSNIL